MFYDDYRDEKNKLLNKSFKMISAVSKDAEIRKDFNYHFKELHLSGDQNFNELHDKVYIWIPSARKVCLSCTVSVFCLIKNLNIFNFYVFTHLYVL